MKHQNLDLHCLAPTCVTSPTLPPPLSESSSVTHHLASNPLQLPQLHSSSSSSPSSTDLSRVRLASPRPPKDDLGTKPRIWSLADVATRGMDRSKEGVEATPSYPISSEPQPVRPKFQPWAEDNRWAAGAGHHPKPDDAVMRRNQPPVHLTSSPGSVHHPGSTAGTNIHWSLYRTLSTATAGPFSFGSAPVSFYLDKYHQSQLPVNAPSLRG